jgi:hypothetical protein
MTNLPVPVRLSDPISKVRRNHALEHATLRILTTHNPRYRLAGYSDFRGFWITGEIDIQDLQEAVDEALSRLKAGESGLAVHPNCGTNFVSSGIVAGSLGYLGMLGGGKDWRSKMDRWPMVIALVTIGLIVSQPLGPWMQANVTTKAQMGNLRVLGITRYQRKGIPLHRVLTRG